MNVFNTFKAEFPGAMYRLGSVGILAALLTVAVIYSRGGNVAAEVVSQQAFQQPKDRQQAEGRFIATPKALEVAEDKSAEIANAFPLPRARPVTPGFYYELVRAQGDGEEGEYVLTERRCIPSVDTPQPCYQPERGRQSFPIRRE
jgi:hypothetical protein